ncbi:MAG: hypothetical protein ACKOU6_20595 [Planctomycetota bacterium]
MARPKKEATTKSAAKATRESVESGPNKSQAIRDYLAQHPRAKPRVIVAALKEQGVEVQSSLVSMVKFYQKKASRKKKAAAVKNSAASAPVARAPRSDAPSLSLETLVLAKKLVASLGGVAEAQKALRALSQLMG